MMIYLMIATAQAE